jgi:tRNA modification GTPase
VYAPDDTIAAIATASGLAGLAVVRLSGRAAVPIADVVFRGASRLAAAPSHTLHHGWVVAPAPGEARAAGGDAGERIDEVVVALFRAPRSYTREDVVEITCHGGRVSADRILEALLAAGARLAGPGEFSLRAFLNGRIDLAQAEAVADVIHAETEAAHTLACAQLAGDLSRRLSALGERVTEALAEIEARVDFAEDVGSVEVPPRVIEAVAVAARDLADLLAGSAFARAVREGARVPLIGRPNVGKSSLFNALVGEERAIVTEIPGTTRDRVSEAIEVAGVRLTLSDTAGLRRAAIMVEAIGVERTEHAIAESRIVLWVIDSSDRLGPDDAHIARRLAGKSVVIALNKKDLGAVVLPEEAGALLGNARWSAVAVSAARRDGLDALRESLAAVLHEGGRPHGLAVSNSRHVEALDRARAAFDRAVTAGRERRPGEIVALELREGLGALGEVTGQTVGEDLLERIFSRFCIGK